MDFDKPNADHEKDLIALERRLAAWRPAGGALNRDRMLFDAGRATERAEGRLWCWRMATAVLVLLNAGARRVPRPPTITTSRCRDGPREPNWTAGTVASGARAGAGAGH